MNTPTKCKGRIRRNRIDLGPCNFKEWKDGYCKIHHPDEKKRKNSDRIKVKENLYQQGMKNKKEAMDEHVKSVAVRFAEWIKNRSGEEKMCLIDNAWFFDSDEEGIYELNEADLFDKFTEEEKLK
jgi:hypothetical protein